MSNSCNKKGSRAISKTIVSLLKLLQSCDVDICGDGTSCSCLALLS